MFSRASRGWLGASALAILTACVLAVGPARAQTTDGGIVHAVGTSTGKSDGKEIQPVGCSSCGGGLLAPPAALDAIGPVVGGPGGIGGCAGCACGGEQCYAGKFPCTCDWHPATKAGELFKGLYNCVCCNDPCYEPKWIALANSAFFADSPRPVTHMKLGADSGWDLRLPDKGELFWARQNLKGPTAGGFTPGATPPPPGLTHVDYMDGYLYNETALGGFGFFIYTPIRHVDPSNSGLASYNSGSGFGDMALGTKSVILDCELLLATFQFKTWLPTGNATRGVGTGHVSMEPSLLASLKLTPYSYLQGQLAYRFPIGGDPQYQGSMGWGTLSYNHLLWNCGHDIELIGTFETNVACLNNGQYTDPVTGLPLPGRSLGTWVNAGPGIRMVICNKIDFGVGTNFHITNNSQTGNIVRAEFRWRF